MGGRGLNNLPEGPQPRRRKDRVRIHTAAWFQALNSKPLHFTKETFQGTDQNMKKVLNLTGDQGASVVECARANSQGVHIRPCRKLIC